MHSLMHSLSVTVLCCAFGVVYLRVYCTILLGLNFLCRHIIELINLIYPKVKYVFHYSSAVIQDTHPDTGTRNRITHATSTTPVLTMDTHPHTANKKLSTLGTWGTPLLTILTHMDTYPYTANRNLSTLGTSGTPILTLDTYSYTRKLSTLGT